MAPTKVIIIGCGIAGPVLAVFLKMKGYHPVVYDRIEGVVEAGICLLTHPNGLRILAQIPGLLEKFPDTIVDRFEVFSTVPGYEGPLCTNNVPSTFGPEYGLSLKPIIRTEFHRILVESAVENGIEIHWNHKLTALEELEDTVLVTFDNGVIDTGSFVVGCDGLHSKTRTELFGHEKAQYTGLAQTSGIGKTPPELANSHSLLQWFGNGAHLVSCRPSETQHSWAVTHPEPESTESWRTVDKKTMEETRAELLATWNSGIPKQLIEGTETIIKYGCYDRPELKVWHKGRAVLLGDAAHPTSPHLGQGANQAFEDVLELVRCLEKYNPGAGSPSTTTLDTLFAEYETTRLPRSSAMVKGARAGGEARVTIGINACLERNEMIKEVWGNEVESAKRYRALYTPAPVNLVSS